MAVEFFLQEELEELGCDVDDGSFGNLTDASGRSITAYSGKDRQTNRFKQTQALLLHPIQSFYF